jgi:ribose 5-phosphate isomerase B
MRVGIATDHGGFGLKEELSQLHAAGNEVVGFGADSLLPLAHAVVAGKVERGIAICGSGVGASVCANKVPGVRAALIHDHFSARQRVQDDHMNILCMGGRTVGPCVAWDLVQAFLQGKYRQASRHLRRLAKIVAIFVRRNPHGSYELRLVDA